jgi:hypothetical protein
MDLLLNLLNYSQKFPNSYFCEIFELQSLETTQKTTSGYLLCDNATLSPISLLESGLGFENVT